MAVTATVTEYKHFSVLTVPVLGKRSLYPIVTNTRRDVIGGVEWYDPWRQYVLTPEPNTVWSVGCMNDVAAFIATLK